MQPTHPEFAAKPRAAEAAALHIRELPEHSVAGDQHAQVSAQVAAHECLALLPKSAAADASALTSLRIPSPVSVQYTAPARILFAMAAPFALSVDRTVEASPSGGGGDSRGLAFIFDLFNFRSATLACMSCGRRTRSGVRFRDGVSVGLVRPDRYDRAEHFFLPDVRVLVDVCDNCRLDVVASSGLRGGAASVESHAGSLGLGEKTLDLCGEKSEIE